MRDEFRMRTTINLDDDVLQSARALAQRYRKSLGEILSALARESLAKRASSKGQDRNGIPIFDASPDGSALDIDSINKLRDS